MVKVPEQGRFLQLEDARIFYDIKNDTVRITSKDEEFIQGFNIKLHKGTALEKQLRNLLRQNNKMHHSDMIPHEAFLDLNDILIKNKYVLPIKDGEIIGYAVSPEDGRLASVHASQEKAIYMDFTNHEPSDEGVILLGVNNPDEPSVSIDLKEKKNLIITGDPGSGKTILINSIIAQFYSQNQSQRDFLYFNGHYQQQKEGAENYSEYYHPLLHQIEFNDAEFIYLTRLKSIMDNQIPLERPLTVVFDHFIGINSSFYNNFNAEGFISLLLDMLENGHKLGINVILSIQRLNSLNDHTYHNGFNSSCNLEEEKYRADFICFNPEKASPLYPIEITNDFKYRKRTQNLSHRALYIRGSSVIEFLPYLTPVKVLNEILNIIESPDVSQFDFLKEVVKNRNLSFIIASQ